MYVETENKKNKQKYTVEYLLKKRKEKNCRYEKIENKKLSSEQINAFAFYIYKNIDTNIDTFISDNKDKFEYWQIRKIVAQSLNKQKDELF